MTANGADATAERGREMDIPSLRVRNCGVGNEGGGDLRRPLSEHRCGVYRNKAHYGPVSGGMAAPRVTGFEAGVET